MEEDKGGGGAVVVSAASSSRVSATLALPAPPPLLPAPPQNHPNPCSLPQPSSAASPPPPAPSSSKILPPKGSNKRQMFTVQLKAGETTIVSWKKLLREASRKNLSDSTSSMGPAAEPHLDSRAAPPSSLAQASEGDLQDAPPSHRFSAVIEKIERLYMGKQSSDEEELDDIPDDDQYDTEDSFIDDAELDEYFQVDKLSTKHNGYFVNRGKLEGIEPSSPNLAPKKRRRKDSTKETESKSEHIMSEVVNTGNVRMKAAARCAPLMGKKLASPDKKQTALDEHYQEGKILKKKLNASAGTYKKSAESNINFENPSAVRILKNFSSMPLELKDQDRRKAGAIPSADISNKSRLTIESSDSVHHASRDISVSSQVESHSRRSLDGNEAEMSTKIRRKERYGTDGFSNMDSGASAYSMQAVQASSRRAKEGSAIRPKGTTLERAIRDLEKIVALCRPNKLDFVEVDASSQGVKRRLPQEVKQKLAKVARLSASQNKISEEDLIDRLMGIVGHIVQRKTLKRNMREMVESGLSAKQQKADRFQQIKQEVNEMIRTRVSLFKSKASEKQDGSADDFQEINGNDDRRPLRKYGLDIGMEDKICELYDLYIEEIDEEKGPRGRKLYAELAELWPNGYMDSNAIKDAISRSRERKRSRIYRHKVRDEERIKRKRLASAIKEDHNLSAPLQSRQEKPATDSTANQAPVPPEKVAAVQPITSSGRMLEPSPPSNHSTHHHGTNQSDKSRVSNSTSTSTSTAPAPDNGIKTGITDVKKKIKRKPESDMVDNHLHPTKLPSHHVKERPSSHKHSYETNVSQQPKPAIQSANAEMPSSNQQS